jgi:dihydrodipicolinate synthase/N-acetylneuraminate lyase
MDCSGLGVAIVTPFKEDASLDEPALRKIARYLVENGVDYIVCPGYNGGIRHPDPAGTVTGAGSAI